MKFEIYKTSGQSSSAPCKNAFFEKMGNDEFPDKWFIEINTLSELILLLGEVGESCVISPPKSWDNNYNKWIFTPEIFDMQKSDKNILPTIEIYDSYRE